MSCNHTNPINTWSHFWESKPQEELSLTAEQHILPSLNHVFGSSQDDCIHVSFDHASPPSLHGIFCGFVVFSRRNFWSPSQTRCTVFSFFPYQLWAQLWQHMRAANDMRIDVEEGGMHFLCHYLYVKQICLWPHPSSILITFWP